MDRMLEFRFTRLVFFALEYCILLVVRKHRVLSACLRDCCTVVSGYGAEAIHIDLTAEDQHKNRNKKRGCINAESASLLWCQDPCHYFCRTICEFIEAKFQADQGVVKCDR